MGLSVVLLVVFDFVLDWTVTDKMGQANSHSSLSHPLNMVLAHFKEVKTRAHNLSVNVNKKKMHRYCSSESYLWPPEGTIHLPTVLAVEDKVFQKAQGHPEQVPYIVVWKDLVANPPALVRSFLLPLTSTFIFRNNACPYGRRTKVGSLQVF